MGEQSTKLSPTVRTTLLCRISFGGPELFTAQSFYIEVHYKIFEYYYM